GPHTATRHDFCLKILCWQLQNSGCFRASKGRATLFPRSSVLKLRKVELLGFKSFCEKTQIVFSGSGVTCIIGPNGCGKSNVVDAISWVLGEQSHKMLRAERMSDVSLTLVDPELADAVAKVFGDKPESSSENGPENPTIPAESASPELEA